MKGIDFMATFGDNIKRAVSDTARAAVKKSEEVIETAKNKYSEFDLNGEINELYRELGKIVCTAYNEDTDCSEEIKNLCLKINEKIEELDTLKNK